MVNVPGAIENGLTLHPWTCRQCGASFGTGVPSTELDAHLETCEKHPMRGLEVEIACLRRACQQIVALSAGWDMHGSIGPKSPLSWESVARISMDIARHELERTRREGQ